MTNHELEFDLRFEDLGDDDWAVFASVDVHLEGDLGTDTVELIFEAGVLPSRRSTASKMTVATLAGWKSLIRVEHPGGLYGVYGGDAVDTEGEKILEKHGTSVDPVLDIIRDDVREGAAKILYNRDHEMEHGLTP